MDDLAQLDFWQRAKFSRPVPFFRGVRGSERSGLPAVYGIVGAENRFGDSRSGNLADADGGDALFFIYSGASGHSGCSPTIYPPCLR